MPRCVSRLPRTPASLLAVAAAASALLAGCGDGGEGTSELAQFAPPDAPFYVEAAIFPDDERTDAIASLTERIGGISDPKGELISEIDAELRSADLDVTYEEDVEPWMGEEAALFARSFEAADVSAGMADVAYLATVTDVDAAQSFIDDMATADPDEGVEERTYGDVTYRSDGETAAGLVDGTLVVGTEAGFKAAVDASGGDSLADSEDFSEHVGSLDDDAIAEAWVDLGTAFDAAAASADEADVAQIDGARAALEPILSEPITARLEATEDSVALETSSGGTAGVSGSSELLGGLPAGAWFAFATQDYGETLTQSLESLGRIGAELGDPNFDIGAITSGIEAQTGLDIEEDVLSWIGDVGVFVSGTTESDFNAGVVIGTSDPEAAANAVDAATELFEQQTGVRAEEPQLEGAEAGFTATGPGGATIEVALRDDQLIAAIGEADLTGELADAESPLSEDPVFEEAEEALGDDFAAGAYVGIQDFLAVAEQGDDGDTDYDAARPYTQALEYFVFGTGEDGDRDSGRFVLGVGD